MGIQTEAEVCNLGLAAIGQTAFINSLNEDSPEAQVAKEIYPGAVDVLLERADWKFASRRKALAVVVDADEDPDDDAVRDGWRFVYALPSDCIAPRQLVIPGIRTPSADQRIVFDVEADAENTGRGNITRRVLLTDQEEAVLRYTARVVTPALWSPLFVEAMSWFLASKFALAIQKKPAVAATMDQKFERAVVQAFASQLRQAREDQPPESEFTRIRK